MTGLIHSQLMSWPIGLNYVNSGSPLLNPSLGRENKNGFAKNAAASNPEMHVALHQEALKRSHQFQSGILRYLHSPMPKPQTSADAVMNPHDALKFHYYVSADENARKRPLLFLIPSLVNKHYILDLRPEASLVRHLTALGFDAVLVEWPIPTESDGDLTTADYVEMLLAHLQRHWDKLDRPLLTIGYCMGGVLALALAQLFPRVQSLALLATPWDYSQYPVADLKNEQEDSTQKWVEESPLFSQEALQWLIYLSHPYRLYLRFSRFALEQDAARISSFVALEHWANDGVPISRAVARECLITWPREHTLLHSKWKVAGELINPSQLKVPCFLAVPEKDCIVPPEVSLPLVEKLQCPVTLYRPQAGHVGMIAGMKRHQLWGALENWLMQFRRD